MGHKVATQVVTVILGLRKLCEGKGGSPEAWVGKTPSPAALRGGDACFNTQITSETQNRTETKDNQCQRCHLHQSFPFAA